MQRLSVVIRMSDKMTYRYFMPLYKYTQKDKEEMVRYMARRPWCGRSSIPNLWLDLDVHWGRFTRTVFLVVE